MANQTEILETIVAGTCRKRFELQKLRRILGYGEAIYPPKLPPLSIHRDEWLEILESGGEDLHLSDDIVPIVAETQFPGSLCRAVFDFEPEQQWRNYDKVKAAAPGMLAALGLRDIWWDWFGDSWVGAPAGEIHTEPDMLYEFYEGGIRPDFLLHAMLEQYFANDQIDFGYMFPPCEQAHRQARSLLEHQAAEKIAHFFEVALKRDFPDRPDLIFQEDLCVRNLNHELLHNTPDPGECVRLTSEIKTAEPPPRHCSEEMFYRQQRERHFQDFL